MAGRNSGLRGVLMAIALVSFAAVGAALVSQHVFDMPPCPWCVLQRLIFVSIGAVALLGAVVPVRAVRSGAGVLVLLLSLSGMASALWQHFKAAKSASCNLTLADKIINALHVDTALPDIFAPRASCAEGAVKLFGISYDFWSLGLFALAAIAVVWRMRNSGR